MPIINRVDTLLKTFTELCPSEIKEIFISEYIKDDGTRDYENLWFFSDNYMMESKRFITDDNFDITPYNKSVRYMEMLKQNYEPGQANERSRLLVRLNLETEVAGNMKASKENCDKLWSIVFEYFKANLKQ